MKLPTFLVYGEVSTDGEGEFIESAPRGGPAGFVIALTHQEADEFGEVAEEIADGGQIAFAVDAQRLPPDDRNDVFDGKVGWGLSGRVEDN